MDITRLFKSLDEMRSLIKLKIHITDKATILDKETTRPSLKKCYELLKHSARSLYLVISAVKAPLRDAICVYYLILRAMDTIEDDMTIPANVKYSILRTFVTIVKDPNWRYTQSQDKDAVVLEQFPCISKEFSLLSVSYQQTILASVPEIGEGLSTSQDMPYRNVEEFKKYTRYATGIPATQVFEMFRACQPVSDAERKVIEDYGILIQVTNDLRDFYQDLQAGRKRLWPESVWKKYASDVREFTSPDGEDRGRACLNELITLGLEVIPSCMDFLARCPSQECLTFFAIPQVMGIATLSSLYNNPKVFHGAVKIRKGEAAHIMLNSTSIDKVKAMNARYISEILARVPNEDPNSATTRQACKVALSFTQTPKPQNSLTSIHFLGPLLVIVAITFLLILMYF
ncbi:squalene synthase-like [Physella acuta]|uniref:squalene synthase-like n=1 Tax=Physella acuta TaxID=109671 RepID=UPI0027DD75B5|nr:squalene synthase-like [Physella acuta]